MSLRASKVQQWTLLRREYRQIQPEAISVAVRDLPLGAKATLSFLRARSIVAGLILISFSLTAGVVPKADHRAI
jgi:hypothetical protein